MEKKQYCNAVTIENNNFITLGLVTGDTAIFNNEPPEYGDLTILEYKNRRQIVWLLGKDMFDYPIVATEYIGIPKVTSCSALKLNGRLINILKVGAIA